MKRSIEEILDNSTGELKSARDVLDVMPTEEKDLLRRFITENRKDPSALPYLCGCCFQPIYIARQKRHCDRGHNHYFKHFSGGPECAQKYGSMPIEQIRAQKYNGIKESLRHRQIKALIVDCLTFDKSVDSDSIKVEQRVVGDPVTNEWRRPDVMASYRGLNVAFEVQLSTEFITVIVEREEFYRKFGGMIWVFSSFNPDDPRSSDIDILTGNKNQVFVVDETTVYRSQDESEFVFRCYYKWPVRVEDKITDHWLDDEVKLSDLTFEAGKFFFKNPDVERQRLDDQIQEEEKLRQQKIQEQRRLQEQANMFRFSELFSPLTEVGIGAAGYKDRPIVEINAYLRSKNIIHSFPDKALETIVRGLYSLKIGTAYGYKHHTLLWLANNILDHYPEHGLLFLRAAYYSFNRHSQLMKEDIKGKFEAKKESLRAALKQKQVVPSHEYNDVIALAFPELVHADGEKLNLSIDVHHRGIERSSQQFYPAKCYEEDGLWTVKLLDLPLQITKRSIPDALYRLELVLGQHLSATAEKLKDDQRPPYTGWLPIHENIVPIHLSEELFDLVSD